MGLPIGVQIVARLYEDRKSIAVASLASCAFCLNFATPHTAIAEAYARYQAKLFIAASETQRLLPAQSRRLGVLRPGFTPKQGQYLAFIHAYTLVLGRPPAETDLKRFLRVTPPSVHQMVLCERRASGWIHSEDRSDQRCQRRCSDPGHGRLACLSVKGVRR